MSAKVGIQVYKARKNLILYLKNLGYNTDKYDDFSLLDINIMNSVKVTSGTNSPLDMSVENPTTGEKCEIIYMITVYPRHSNIENTSSMFYMNMTPEEKKMNNLIIIINNPANDTILKTVKKQWNMYNDFLTIMDIQSLQINLLTHEYVPKHEKLTDQEKKELYEEFNIQNDKQVPEISQFDPVAKSILLRPGQVCRIHRYDKISYSNIYYRICV